MRGIRVDTPAWPLIEERFNAGAHAVLPIGAACKEHGRHLPMNTDQLQAEWITERLMTELDVVVWPTVTYGYYPVFVEYPGGVSLSEPTFIGLVGDILDGIEHAGARYVVILNIGISTIPPVRAALKQRADPATYQLVNVYSGPRFTCEVELHGEQQWGGHADEIETSMMLVVAGQAVDMSFARSAPLEIVRGRFNRVDPSQPNYSPDGVNGDPSLAKRWKGERLLDVMSDDVLAAMSGNAVISR
jgi:creatinine amidohydrolase